VIPLKKVFRFSTTNFEISAFESRPIAYVCSQQFLLLYVTSFSNVSNMKIYQKVDPIFVGFSIVSIQKISDFSFNPSLDPSHKNFITHITKFTV
jgi:hypothetical protein